MSRRYLAGYDNGRRWWSDSVRGGYDALDADCI